tara:strand:- start:2793 stop:3038 length:246 start_codon:yes stop_codon:yes gene_type:complete
MIKNALNRRAFRSAEKDLNENEMLCGTMINNKPHYFSMPKDATDMEVREHAFELREGRKMSSIERSLLSIAEGAQQNAVRH